MLAVVPSIVGEEASSNWRHYLRGLWACGLRLGESLDVWWDRLEKILPVFPKNGRAMLQVPGELEKGNTDRLLPIAREFSLFLTETPDVARTGPVFRLDGSRGRYRAQMSRARRCPWACNWLHGQFGVQPAKLWRLDRVRGVAYGIPLLKRYVQNDRGVFERSCLVCNTPDR